MQIVNDIFGINYQNYSVIPNSVDFNKFPFFQILASFRESPGLSSLEALGSGMNVVVCESDYCPTDTYFNGLINQYVFVCDPYSRKSIHQAMIKADEANLPTKNLIEKFNWSNTGHKTYESYVKIISDSV